MISTDKGLSTRRTRLVDFLVAWVWFLVYPTSSRLGGFSKANFITFSLPILEGLPQQLCLLTWPSLFASEPWFPFGLLGARLVFYIASVHDQMGAVASLFLDLGILAEFEEGTLTAVDLPVVGWRDVEGLLRNSPRRKESFGTIRFSVRPVVGPQIAINLLSNTYILGLLKASAVRTTSHYLRYSVFCLAQYVLNAHGSCTLLLQLYIRVHSHSWLQARLSGVSTMFWLWKRHCTEPRGKDREMDGSGWKVCFSLCLSELLPV